ncbi:MULTISPECIES: hypothetical protein [unclassified Glutamicibacter]|uniref:hypothetical protein n=1 Tax=unclassified Glutamicibacter TaxID=2627139 RepID=UPI00381D6587
MVLSEGFECTVPSDDAVKGSVVNCVGTAPDNYLVMGDVATWVAGVAGILTALLTIGLLIAAIRAWRVAKGTLERMEKDAKAADERLHTEIRELWEAEERRARHMILFEFLDSMFDILKKYGTYEQLVARRSMAEHRAVKFDVLWSKASVRVKLDGLIRLSFELAESELEAGQALAEFNRSSKEGLGNQGEFVDASAASGIYMSASRRKEELFGGLRSITARLRSEDIDISEFQSEIDSLVLDIAQAHPELAAISSILEADND